MRVSDFGAVLKRLFQGEGFHAVEAESEAWRTWNTCTFRERGQTQQAGGGEKEFASFHGKKDSDRLIGVFFCEESDLSGRIENTSESDKLAELCLFLGDLEWMFASCSQRNFPLTARAQANRLDRFP